MNVTCREERGSVLVIAVIAMLIMAILSFSFAMLARLEMTTGFNYKAQGQAEALAEAGLERGRDAVRTAASEPCGFTRWTDAANSGSYAGCGAGLVKLLFNGVGLEAGNYSAVIDNDCSPLVPVTIQDSSCTGASPARDTNETAVVTAWATAANGQGRARVRAVLGVDTAWKHVCSSSSQDNSPGYCNEPANRNGTPSITPADPNEYPGGPAAYDDLPRPTLGCSAIDPLLHDPTPGNCPPGANDDYPYTTGRRYVVQGDATKGTCGTFGGVTFRGYFDCALTTPCEAPIPGCPRKACVPAGDPRLADTSRYWDASSAGGCGNNTGMVFRGVSYPTGVTWNNIGAVGAAGNGRNMYVMNTTFSTQQSDFHGVIVVEGDGGGGDDLQHRNQSRIWTEQTNTTHGRPVYGYPLAYLVYDPELPAPTANPLVQQDTFADMGSAAGTEVYGIVYSGGNVEFNPVILDGGVVAFQIQTQGTSSAYTYNPAYGNVTPPPGFPEGSGNTVLMVRKSFIVCVNYAADTGGGTPCQ
jgi:Tfp pilus assembly protein PilX